jgi:hypothetical protein
MAAQIVCVIIAGDSVDMQQKPSSRPGNKLII